MTQSKDDEIIIDLSTMNDTVPYIDTSYTTDTGSEYTFNVSGSLASDTIDISDISLTSSSTLTIDTTNYTYSSILDNMIDPDEIDRMCKEYPALTKVWQNFKSVYDMVKQDYKGKKDAGEIDDIIPF